MQPTDTPIFTISELHEMLNLHLAHLGEIAIQGEISELKPSGTQWLYVTLKDESAVIKLFATQWDIHNWRSLEVGMSVKVLGVVRTYARYGTLSVTISSIEPVGEGASKLAFEKLKNQLEKEGLFDPSRKRELPHFPQKIGLITAKGSQAYNDFIKVLANRMGGIHIYFAPAQVQGESAPRQIAQAIEHLNTHHSDLDVIVVCRGGGSQEDLQAFNTELVARAIFTSATPIITGVGHEGDVTLADFVADVRASTPSNAAELLVRERESVLQGVHMLTLRMDRALTRMITQRRELVTQAQKTLSHALFTAVARKRESIHRFHLSQQSIHARLQQSKSDITHMVRLLNSLDPTHVLSKGYAIVRLPNGRIVRGIHEVKVGESLTIQLTDGTIDAQATAKNSSNK